MEVFFIFRKIFVQTNWTSQQSEMEKPKRANYDSEDCGIHTGRFESAVLPEKQDIQLSVILNKARNDSPLTSQLKPREVTCPLSPTCQLAPNSFRR